jgi:hypothetical protein
MPNDVDHQRLYSYYREDLELAYPSGYKIIVSDKLEKGMNSQVLPYLIIDGTQKEVYLSGDTENWKDQVIKSGKYSKEVIIKPIPIEEYENEYAPTVYYIRFRSKIHSKLTMIVHSAYRQDLETMYYGFEIFSTKWDYSFNRLYLQALPYILEHDGILEVVDIPGREQNWKERVIQQYADQGKNVLIYPYSVTSLLKDYESMGDEWRKSLGGKSILQHLAESVQANKIEAAQNDNFTEYIDDDSDSSDPNYCHSCQSSPCMCSDPERTSTINS